MPDVSGLLEVGRQKEYIFKYTEEWCKITEWQKYGVQETTNYQVRPDMDRKGKKIGKGFSYIGGQNTYPSNYLGF